MALTADTLIQEIETMTVLELANLVKALEERFGVSAAAVAAPAAGGAAAAAAVEEQTEFNVELARSRRQQAERHQGGPRDRLRPGPQGGQGPGRRRPQGRQGRRHQGRSRQDQGKARSCRRQGRHQVKNDLTRQIQSARCLRTPCALWFDEKVVCLFLAPESIPGIRPQPPRRAPVAIIFRVPGHRDPSGHHPPATVASWP